MPVKLTELGIDKMVPKEAGKRLEVTDALTPGLMLRVSGPRNKTWTALYRVAGEGGPGARKEATRGTLKKMALGAWPGVSLKAARERARAIAEQADRGVDPAAARDDAAAKRKAGAFEAVLERFVELHVKPNTKEGRFARDRAKALEDARAKGGPMPKGPNSRLGRVAAQRIIEDATLHHWRGRMIDTISRADVNDLLDDVIEEDGKARARELRKHLSKLFNWAADRGHLVASPMVGMRRPELGYKARERVLSMEELRRVWDAAGALGRRPGEGSYPFGPAYRLLILTGQRRSEIAELQRAWVEPGRRAVEIPAAHYKGGKRSHVVPLSEPAWELVQSLPRWNGGDYVFSTDGPGRPAGARPISGFSKAKELIETKVAELGEKAGLPPMEPWTVHDIRRSVATHMARLGVPLDHIERVLGHVIGGVAGTYQHHAFFDEKRAALEAWGKIWTA